MTHSNSNDKNEFQIQKSNKTQENMKIPIPKIFQVRLDKYVKPTNDLAKNKN